MSLSPSDLDRLEALARASAGRDYDRDQAMASDLLSFCDTAEGLPDLILSLVAMARRAPRWIPVEERTPELPPRPVPENKYATVSSAPVLVLVKDGSVHVALWEATKIYPAEWTFQDHEETTSTGDDATHWMPLPEPPEGV